MQSCRRPYEKTTTLKTSSSSYNTREVAVKRALDLLREMTRAYHQTTTTTIKPTTENYNNVLECLTVSKNPKSIDHSMMLLDALEEAFLFLLVLEKMMMGKILNTLFERF